MKKKQLFVTTLLVGNQDFYLFLSGDKKNRME
jgi:hypothetical protein